MQDNRTLEEIKESITHLGENFAVEYSNFHKRFVRNEELKLALAEIHNKLDLMYRDIQDNKENTGEIAEQTKIANGRTRTLEDKTLQHDNDIEQLNLLVSKFYELFNAEKKTKDQNRKDWVVWVVKKAVTAILLLLSWLLIASGVLNIPNY